MRDFLKNPIFVVGYQHSGTTLLENILGNASFAYTTHLESTFFEHKYIVRQRFPSLAEKSELKRYVIFLIDLLYNGFKLQGGHTVDGRSSNKGLEDYPDPVLTKLIDDLEPPITHGRLFRRVYDFVARKHGCERWIEKTPTHIFHADDIVRDIPDAFFVEMVRDPRDILAGKKTRVSTVWTDNRFGEKEKWFRAQWMAFDPILDALSWKATIRAGVDAKRRHHDRWFRLRYEDLVEEPELHIRNLCEFLEFDFETEMLNVSGRGGAEWDKHRTSQGVRKDSVGRWQNVLTPNEIFAGQWIAGDEMVKLGYSRRAVGAKARLVLPVLLGRSGMGILKRLASKWRVGGWEYFSNVLHNWKDRAVHMLGASSKA